MLGFKRALLFATFVASPAAAGEWGFTGMVGGELRGFFQSVQFPGQFDGAQPSIILNPELGYLTEDGRHQFHVSSFTRLDSRDSNRTHHDVREAYWRYVGESFDVLAGFNQVFWGVAESRHLVDIVNQTDFVEDIDGEDKLGQPMVQLNLQRSWGNLGVFVMPGFRQRTFAGLDGRVRFPLPVDDEAQFESAAGARHVDYALRYAHYLGDWDVGVSLFHGTSREPRFEVNGTGNAVVPHYDITSQVGTDVQYTKDAWLWKFEGMLRDHRDERFAAVVAGVEYTFYQAFDSAADVGVLVEYLRDDRGPGAPPTVFDDDIFVGARVALNDTQDTAALAGAVVDRNHGATAVRIELERRLSDHFKLEVESRLFFRAGADDVLRSFARDDFAVVRLAWFF